jgi:hypothetical protein
VLGGARAPTGKRLAPVLSDLVPRLRRFGELVVTDDTAARLVAISPATIDRRLAAMTLRGRSHTKPGSLRKDAIAIRTWAQWSDAVPGFVEIDLVSLAFVLQLLVAMADQGRPRRWLQPVNPNRAVSDEDRPCSPRCSTDWLVEDVLHLLTGLLEVALGLPPHDPRGRSVDAVTCFPDARSAVDRQPWPGTSRVG